MLVYKIFVELVRSLARIVHYAIPVSYRGVVEVINDHQQDKRLGIETSWLPLLTSSDVRSLAGSNKDGTRYESPTYRRLMALITTLAPTEQDVLVDLGCGKGRMVMLFSTGKVKKAIGVEFDAELAEDAKKNVRDIKVSHAPVQIIQGDAADFATTEVTIYYLYNPFGPKTMATVLENIRKSWLANPRTIRIVYVNAVCRDLLGAQTWLKHDGECPGSGAGIWRTVGNVSTGK